MIPFNFTKKSRLNPEITIDINYREYDKTISIESITFDEYGEVVLTPINGFHSSYDYSIKRNTLYIGDYIIGNATATIPW